MYSAERRLRCGGSSRLIGQDTNLAVLILRMKNRPGNVHDSKQSWAFLREVIDGVQAAFGRRLPVEFRMDAAFFQRDVLRLLAARSCAYAIKVGYWSWLPLKQLAAERTRWRPVAPTSPGSSTTCRSPNGTSGSA
jgi:hypothetical protein